MSTDKATSQITEAPTVAASSPVSGDEGNPSSVVPDMFALSDHELFKGIPLPLLKALLAQCQTKYLEPGEILISPGQENHHLYLLMSGRLQVYLEVADSQMGFPIDPGECIGEMSIIEERLTSAAVIAETASCTIVLPKQLFWDQFIWLPGAMKNLLRLLSRRMRKDNEVLLSTLEKQLRYEHLQKELTAAGKIQANFLPQEIPLLPEHPEVDVCAFIEPAKEVGGDFFDVIALDRQHVCVTVGDVSGKGMPAALFMVRVMTLLRSNLTKPNTFQLDLEKVNGVLCQNNEECMFVTLFVAILNLVTGKLMYMNGGHNAPFLSSGGKPFALMSVPKGILLGIQEEAHYEVAERTLQPNDTLVIYTDGVIEAENPRQEFFNAERVRKALNSVSLQDDITILVKTLQDQVAHFSRGVPQSDDITLLALRYRGALAQETIS